ncbi:hypothetical protein TSUD_340210 [Trifolium subterraneum]|uniref:Uncharacterized protein n=1 Tax=Trifolium subterraneum TaxID=3900 RepID=A0A2Z6MH93_TRISU|nr:hypothetical protein TSUD_340210 [Trifolium subterraneum]
MAAKEAVGELTATLGESKSLRDVYEVTGDDLSKRSSKSKLEERIGGFDDDGRSLLGVMTDRELWRRMVAAAAVVTAESHMVVSLRKKMAFGRNKNE